MTIIEKIKAEIERLIEESDFDESANLYSLLSFLSTLESEKPVPNDLEDAAMNYIAPIENEDGLKVINFSGQDIKDAFIAGAEWQKEQMMKEAVPFYEILKAVPPGPERDKVRIIIIKEN